MKLLKRWLAFFVVVVLVISVAFNSRGPLRASHIGEENTTTNNTGELEGQTAEDTQQAEGDTGENTEQGEPAPDASTAEQPEVQEETPAEPEAPHQDEMELSQVMTGENGEAVCKVTANIPEGTFEANTADVTMEVTYAAADTTEQIKTLMSKAVAEGNVLGNYFLYNVIFKVNGEQVEPGKEIKITFEQNNFQIKDTKKATTFYYNEANSAAGNAEAEIVKITQKSDKIEELQNAGESIDNIDDYDLSEISLKEDGLADKIMMEGRRSTIYGCYVEDQKPQEETADQNQENKEEKTNKPESLKYEDDEVAITVTAEKEGIIPAGSTLQVVPIKKDEKDTKDQYKEVEEKLQEKAEKEEYDIAGFLAYDISFVDADGNKVEPNGEVKVVMDYKEAVLPEEVDEEKAKDTDVTVLHLEEDKKGEVKDVVDMVADSKTEAAVETTNSAEVKKAEFVTDSFSVYTITWTGSSSAKKMTLHYIDTDGNEISDDKTTNPSKTQISSATQLKTYKQDIEGYTFLKTRLGNSQGKDGDSDIDYTNYYIRYRSGWQYSENANFNKYDDFSSNNIYMIYYKSSNDGSSGGGGSTSTLDAPDHSKYIKYNEKDEDYTLTLDVTGGLGKTTPIDILLIVDRSGSMADEVSSSYGRTIYRYNYVNDAISELKSALGNADADINLAAVTFGKNSSVWNNGKWQSVKNFNFQLSYNDCDGGTNWQAGIQEGADLLKSRQNSNPGNKSYVIFLTDGSPTYRYKTGTTTVEGTGSSDKQGYNYKYALNAWNSSPVLTSTNGAYVVNASGSTTNDSAKNCVNFSTAINGKVLHGTNADTMKAEFKKIADEITKAVYTNVVITDKLSQWVDFADEPNVKVQKTDKNGNTSNLPTSSYTYTLDKNKKTVTLNVLKNAELADGVTYSISFDVVPSEAAKDDYFANGKYPDRGDLNTDAVGNATSSEKPGFYSNDSASVSYKVSTEDQVKNAEYKKPVVQVSSLKCDFIFKKVNTSGEPVGGAKFLLVSDKDSSKKYEATSDLSGTVTFKNLTEGTYTLTETEPASGYVKENAEWKVKVEKSGKDKVVAKLYTSGGELVEDSKIVNYTVHEEAVKHLTNDKTVKVVDENNRIFQIDLTASTSGREEGTAAQGASIVLVLDASSSMGSSGMTKLKSAATSFIQSAKDASSISEIAVVWYQGDEGDYGTTSQSDFYQLNSNDNISKLTGFINNKSHYGGTPMGDALEVTNSILTTQAKYDNKYVLFFTDGMPGYSSSSSSFNCMVANHAVNEAKNVKEIATLYTVGYNLGNSYFNWNEGDPSDSQYGHKDHSWNGTYAKNFLSDYIATPPKDGRIYSYTTDNTDGLNDIFNDIAGNIGELFKVNAEKIVDVIDARFKLTDESKEALSKNKDVTIKENEDGTTTITWTGDSAIIGNKDSEDPTSNGWSASFKIQVKDDFIGGNMVPTNGASSGIYVDETTTKTFPQPSVNVKLLKLDMDNKETTVYKGDIINPAAFAKELADTLSILELDNRTTTNTGKPSFPELTESQKKELQEKQTITLGADKSIEYIYPNTEDSVGYFVYTYKLSDNPGGNMNEHAVDKDGKRVEAYELEVQFIPYTTAERKVMSELNGINPPAANGGTELNPKTNKLVTDGEYVVNVIVGEIRITKILDKLSNKDQSFVFKINKDGSDYKTVTITIPAGETSASYKGEELKKLPRGEYEVIESVSNGYSVKAFVIDDITNCESSTNSESESVAFKLGNNKDGEDVIAQKDYENGVLGQVTYTNEEVYNNWDIQKVSASDNNLVLPDAEFELASDAKTYYGKSDSNGVIKWYTDENYTTALEGKMAAGIYTLTETKAPVGYAVSTEKWTLEITKNGDLKSIKSGDKVIEGNMVQDDTTVYFKFENTPVYDLPSAGGAGIFWYTVDGTLLMCLAGLLTLYKNKRKRGVGLSK